MKLNADGIRIDDLMKYRALDILNDIDKSDHGTPLEEQSDTTVTQPEVNPNPEDSTELKSTDEEKNE